MTFRNVGTRTLSRGGPYPTHCRVSQPRDGSSNWIDPAAANDVLGPDGKPRGVTIDQASVLPGDLFTCTFHLVAPNAAFGVYPQYFSPVTEDKAWMLPRDDAFLPLSIADASHVVYPGSAYAATYLNESYPAAAVSPGQGATVQFTFRNTLPGPGRSSTTRALSRPLVTPP